MCVKECESVCLYSRESDSESGREITSNAQLTANFRLKISPEFLLILTNKFIQRIKLKFCDFYDENKKCHRCSKTFSSRKILAEIFFAFSVKSCSTKMVSKSDHQPVQVNCCTDVKKCSILPQQVFYSTFDWYQLVPSYCAQ